MKLLLDVFNYIDMEFYLPNKTLYINESIPVSTLVQIRKFIKDYGLNIQNIIVKGGNK